MAFGFGKSIPFIRAAQLVLSIIVLGLVAAAIRGTHNHFGGHYKGNGFALFVAILSTLITIFFLFWRYDRDSVGHSSAHVALDALLCLLWFLAFIFLVIKKGWGKCGWWTMLSKPYYCQLNKAAAAMSFLAFLAFIPSLIYFVKSLLGLRSGSPSSPHSDTFDGDHHPHHHTGTGNPVMREPAADA